MTVSEPEPRRAGRPLGFDRDTGLAAAMHAFWGGGFHGTSVPELSTATGLSTSSLYNTYGSKLDLFVAALDRYMDVVIDAYMVGPLAHGSAGLDDVDAFLGRLEESTALRPVRGCLAVNTIAEFRNPPARVAARSAAYRIRLREAFAAALARAAERGEVPAGVAGTRADMLVPLIIAFNILVAASVAADECRGVLVAARTLAAAT